MATAFDPTRATSATGQSQSDIQGNAYKERGDSSTSNDRRVKDVSNEMFQKQENQGTGSSH